MRTKIVIVEEIKPIVSATGMERLGTVSFGGNADPQKVLTIEESRATAPYTPRPGHRPPVGKIELRPLRGLKQRDRSFRGEMRGAR